MFAKIAKLRATSPRHAGRGAAALAHSNDNKINAGPAATRRVRRPVLACRWRPISGRGLECRWYVELDADGAATVEPDQCDQCWSIRCLYWLFGIGLTDKPGYRAGDGMNWSVEDGRGT